MLQSLLPEIHALFLPQELLNLPVQETKATCNNCFKAQKHAPKPHYDPKLKCCTFYPFLPNFLVGALLNSPTEHPHFAPVFRKLNLAREYVLPIGVCAPPNYQYQFQGKKPDDYGNRHDLLCPFYVWNGGLCGMWKYRSHECATFFCVSDYKSAGEKLWSFLRDYMHLIEMTLSQEALVASGYNDPQIEQNIQFIRCEPQSLTKNHPQQLSASEWSSVWAHQQERIEEYFLETHRFVMENVPSLRKKIDDNTRIYLDNDWKDIKNAFLSALSVGSAHS